MAITASPWMNAHILFWLSVSLGLFALTDRAAATCAPEPVVQNAVFSPNETSYANSEVVTYVCDDGYALYSGDLVRTCQSNGSWSGFPPVCSETCDLLPDVSFTTVDTNQTFYLENDTVTYTCDNGYEHTSGNLTRICVQGSTWTGTEPVCTAVTCAPEPVVQNAVFSPNETSYANSEVVTYVCDDGYALYSGDLVRTCQSNGSWSGFPPVCSETCDPLPAVSFTTVDTNQTFYLENDTVTYTCDNGYEHTSGDLTRACVVNTTWTGTEPVCTVKCDPLPAVSFTTVDTNQTFYLENDTVTYTCDNGYEHTSGNLTRICVQGSTWTGTEPVCTVVCVAPDTVASSQISPDQSTYLTGTDVTYTCDNSYQHTSGNLTRTCVDNTNWTDAAPVCTATCVQPAAVANSTIDLDIALYMLSETITYTCDIGFKQTSGTLTRDCVLNTSWTGTMPVCTIACNPPPTPEHIQYTPVESNHAVDTNAVYTCDTGYEQAGGDTIRTCLSNRTWTGEDLNCTVVTCNRPGTGYRSTFTPNQSSYDYNTNVTYSCQLGWIYHEDKVSRCTEFKNWSLSAPDCEPVTCTPLTFPFMTYEPEGNVTYGYLNTTEYECIFGYNYSTGSMNRTCDHDELWDGVDPVCVIVTCDPPEAVAHATYAPVQPEHDYNTAVTFTCDIDHHYVSGNYTSVCTHLETWTETLLNCSVNHYLEFNDTNQGLVQVLTTSSDLDVYYKYDGGCNPVASTNPDRLKVVISNITVNDTESPLFLVTLASYSSVAPDIYTVKLWTEQDPRVFPSINLTVFYGRPVLGIAAQLVNQTIQIEVGTPATFELTLTDGTNVTVQWTFETGQVVTSTFEGAFTSTTETHTFNTTGNYTVLVGVSNYISNASTTVDVRVIRPVDNSTFSGDYLTNTTTPAQFQVSFFELPLEFVSIAFSYGDGLNSNKTKLPDDASEIPKVYLFEHSFPTQGQYTVSATVDNAINNKVMTVIVNVWDSLEPLEMIFSDGTPGKYITNTLTTVAFNNVPSSGFEYKVDWNDGSAIEQNSDTSIQFDPYSLGNFTHVFTNPLVYYLEWEVKNQFYYKTRELAIVVQNALPTQDSEYVLEPIGKLYPWINLQSMPVPFNITLNADVPEATNATCVFDPQDGDPVVEGLTFVRDFKYNHNFNSSGTFDSTIYCENEVSNHRFNYSNTVTKFRSEFISFEYVRTVPLNVSSTVEVFFHINNSGFALLPEQVSLRFDFNDGTATETHTYDKTVYSHVYNTRGNYTVNVRVDATVTTTQNVHNLPLRLGYMHFEHNMITAFFNRTLIWYYVWGVPGSSVSYTVDYIDTTVGRCTLSNDIYGCDMSHVFLNHGIKTVVARVDNGTFVEIDEMEITVDGEIKNLIPFIPSEVNIPDGRVTVILNVSLEDSYLPDLNCKIRFADAIDREERLHIQWLRHALPFTYNFIYISLGRRNIEFDCWNLLNSTSFEYPITVTNQDFLYTGSFDRYFSQINTPLPLSAMKDNELFCRLMILADFSLKTPTYAWSLSTQNNRATQLIPRGSEQPDKYSLALNVSFIEEPENVIYEPTFILIVDMLPVPFIFGGPRRYARRGDVNVDATGSFDPVNVSVPVTFEWACKRYTDVTSFDDLIAKHTARTGSESCSLDTVSTGVMKLDTSSVAETLGHAVTVTVTNGRGNTSTFVQHIVTQTTEDLSIICRINCLAKVAVHEKLHLRTTLATKCEAVFAWTLFRVSGTSYTGIPLTDITETGSQNGTLVLKEDSLLYGTQHLVSVQITIGLINYGSTYYQFTTNQIPQGGNCTVYPYENPATTLMNSTIVAKAAVTEFNMTCMGWMDEGEGNVLSIMEPLNFEFYLKYGSSDHDKHIVYFDSGGTSPLLTFRVGDASNSYAATVVIRIFDVYGDFKELNMPVTVKPELSNANLTGLNSTQEYAVVKPYLDTFDDSILKANRSFDYRTLATKIEAVASIYTQMEVVTEESSSSFTPDQLTSLGTLRSADGSLMDWMEFWDVIFYSAEAPTQAYLREKSNTYAETLLFQVQAWPDGKRMSLEAIEIMSRAFKVLVSNRNYINNVTTIHATDFVNLISVKLNEHLVDRILVSVVRIMDIIQVLVDIGSGVLDYLQTVLTPLLPDDPTTDEMRNYLEYISVFQDDGASMLSLQEQTFLVQKQLQKYGLQKYLKSQNSLLVVPVLVTAMKTIGTSMEELSEIGQRTLEVENTFLHVTTMINTAGVLTGTLLVREKVTVELTDLVEQNPGQACAGSTIGVHMINYKINPFFWGTFGDRLTSYTSTFYLTGADLSTTVTARLENKEEAQCVDQTPVYAEDDPDSIIYILFDRVYSDDDMLLFIKPNTTGITYDLFFQTEDKPDIEEEGYFYTTTMSTDIWTAEDGFKLPITAENIPYTGKIWVALRPKISPERESMRDAILNAKFCASVTSGNCLAWKADPATGDNFWDKESCTVSGQSSRRETICTCQYTDTSDDYTIGTTFFVPFSRVDFTAVTSTSVALANTAVIATLIAVAILYLAFIGWAWREDVKDQYKWAYAPLVDNDIADNQFYILRVYTSLRAASGTQSRVGFVLVGEEEDTGVRIMDDDTHIGFDRGSVRTFIMSTRRTLGDLMCLRVWQDDTGKADSSWFLNKITVLDLQNHRRYMFPCDQWLSSEDGDEAVERVLYVTAGHHERPFIETAAYTLVGNHLWVTCFLRPFRSNFSRKQRISCLVGILFISMFVSMLQFDANNDNLSISDEVVVGPFRFSLVNFNYAILSAAVATLPALVAAFLFAYSKPSAENHKNILRRIYKAICARTKHDKTIVATTFTPPISPAVQDSRHFIPHVCVYIAWCIVSVEVILPCYFLATSTTNWPKVTSERWMTTLALSILVSIVLLETGKVIIQILLALVFFERAYEPSEPSVDVDMLVELTRKNTHFTTDGPQFKEHLHYPEIPTRKTLLLNKKARLEESQAMSILYNLVLYIFLLVIVYTISLASRDPRSYQFKLHQEELYNFGSVQSMGTFMSWLNINFTATYFANTYFGASVGNDSFKAFTNDILNIKVGPARLRQVRVDKEPCLGPLGVGVTCYPPYATAKEDKSDYCLGWKNTPCPVSEKADFFTSPAWVYHSTEEVWGFPTEAEFKTYGGGGYFMKLDVNKDVSLEIFKELTAQSWVDRQTRTVILEFTVFNPNANLFSYAKFVAEFPEVGGVVPYTDIQTFRLFTHTGTDGELVMFCEFFFLIYVFIAAISVLYDFGTYGLRYFSSMWRILDFIMLGMSIAIVSIFIYKLFLIEKTIAVFSTDKNAYVGFENLAFYDVLVNTIHSLLVFIMTLRLSRVLGFSGKINEMAAVISSSGKDLAGFFVIFGISYIAYTSMGTLLFGKDTKTYKSIFDTYGTLTGAIIGKNSIQEIQISNPGLAEFFYFTFVLFVLMTLATMAAAILNFSISDVKVEVDSEMEPLNAVELIIGKVKKVVDKFSCFKSKQSDSNEDMLLEEPDADVMEILGELRTSVKKIMGDAALKNVSDKYRTGTPDSVLSFSDMEEK